MCWHMHVPPPGKDSITMKLEKNKGCSASQEIKTERRFFGKFHLNEFICLLGPEPLLSHDVRFEKIFIKGDPEI